MLEKITKVEFYLNKQWMDMTDFIEANEINIQYRRDEAFATGSFQMRCNLKYCIPPYTPVRFNDSEYWLAQSKNRKYLTKNNYYVHDVEIMEMTSVLSCFILGTKNFSITGTNKLDYEKIDIIINLISTKYNVHFALDYNYKEIFNDSQEFSFGSGTTMYDAISAICNSYSNLVCKVKQWNSNMNTFILSFVSANENVVLLNDSFITDIQTYQNADAYSLYVESEMSNIIDRNCPIFVKNLTLRSDDAKMDANNCYLELPTRCEKVIEFGVSSLISALTMWSTLYDPFYTKLTNEGWKAYVNDLAIWTKKFSEWNKIIFETREKYVNGLTISYDYHPLDDILKTVVDRFGIDPNVINNYDFDLKREVNYYYLYPHEDLGNSVSQKAIHNLPMKYSFSDRILSKEEWNLLLDKDKPKYCYYTSNEKKIEGLNNYYKDDFWGKVIGETVKPFLAYKPIESLTRYKIDDGHVVLTSEHSLDVGNREDDYTSINYSYYVKYFPIVNPLIVYKKDNIPLNEDKFKSIGRSYDNGADFIDYDRMTKNIIDNSKSNGDVELSIEYYGDTSKVDIANRIQFENTNWFIASIFKKYILGKTITQFNLTLHNCKIAESIGLKTQYNATKNPTTGIIDRPILLYYNDKISFSQNNSLWCKILCYNKKGELLNDLILFKRVSLMSFAKETYIVCESLNQYSFDKKAVQVGNETLYSCNDVPYVDSNNECFSIEISVGTMDELTFEESLKIPLLDDTAKFKELFSIRKTIIYKDAREHLIFCLKLTNYTILD